MSEILTTSPVPLPEISQIYAKIEDLKSRLQIAVPGYEHLLHEIHVALHKDESLTHLLSEEQIGVILLGLAKKKNIVIAEGERKNGARSRTSAGKSLKEITLDQL